MSVQLTAASAQHGCRSDLGSHVRRPENKERPGSTHPASVRAAGWVTSRRTLWRGRRETPIRWAALQTCPPQPAPAPRPSPRAAPWPKQPEHWGWPGSPRCLPSRLTGWFPRTPRHARPPRRQVAGSAPTRGLLGTRGPAYAPLWSHCHWGLGGAMSRSPWSVRFTAPPGTCPLRSERETLAQSMPRASGCSLLPNISPGFPAALLPPLELQTSSVAPQSRRTPSSPPPGAGQVATQQSQWQ